MEFPGDRNNFRISDLKGYLQEHRDRLLAAALTILSGYLQAVSPFRRGYRLPFTPLGGFEEWSKSVAGAVEHAGLPNPITCQAIIRATLVADDEDNTTALEELLVAIHAIMGKKPFTLADLMETLLGVKGNEGYQKEHKEGLEIALGSFLPNFEKLRGQPGSLKSALGAKLAAQTKRVTSSQYRLLISPGKNKASSLAYKIETKVKSPG